MSESPEDHRPMDPGQLKRYYLGGLTDDEQRDLEARCFEDDDLFAELMEGQTDLVHAYVRGQMSSTDREAFEKHFLRTPAGRRKVRLTRTVLGAIGELDAGSDGSRAPVSTTAKGSPGWLAGLTWNPGRRWIPVTALAAAAIVSIGLVVDEWRLRVRLDRLTADYASLTEREQQARQASESERVRADRLSDTLQEIQSKPGPATEPFKTLAGSVAALSLTPGLARANAAAPQLTIPRGVTIALFELAVDAAEPVGSYRVVVETADGREVWRQETSGLTPGGSQAAVVAAIDASTFGAGDYIIRLQRRTAPESAETIHTYQFHVVRDASRP